MRIALHGSRRVLVIALAGAVSLALVTWLAVSMTSSESPQVSQASQVSADDLGDEQVITSFDGPLVRHRAAIAIHPTEGADKVLLRKQLEAAAKLEKVGPLADASFAVFSPEMLHYLVPEMVVVLREGLAPQDAEYIMKNHKFTGLAFYLVESVFVHDIAFALPFKGGSIKEISAKISREGILTDSLGKYSTTLSKDGLVFKYFGAVLSDGQVKTVQRAIANSAGVSADKVLISPIESGAGVDLSEGVTPESHNHSTGHN